jgi:hypothetical protein
MPDGKANAFDVRKNRVQLALPRFVQLGRGKEQSIHDRQPFLAECGIDRSRQCVSHVLGQQRYAILDKSPSDGDSDNECQRNVP